MSTHTVLVPGARCLSCQQPLVGQYCATCGQPASTRVRITLADLLHDIPHSIWHVDHGVFYTLRELVLRPGQTLRRYLAGERIRFFRPLALLLLLTGLASFLMLIFHIDQVMAEPLSTGSNAAQREAMKSVAEINRLILKYTSWFTLSMLPVYALVSWALLRRLNLYYAEHFLANAVVLLQMTLLPVYKLTAGGPYLGIVGLCESAILPIYQVWAFSQLATPVHSLWGGRARAVGIAILGAILSSAFIYGLAWLVLKLQH